MRKVRRQPRQNLLSTITAAMLDFTSVTYGKLIVIQELCMTRLTTELCTVLILQPIQYLHYVVIYFGK